MQNKAINDPRTVKLALKPPSDLVQLLASPAEDRVTVEVGDWQLKEHKVETSGSEVDEDTVLCNWSHFSRSVIFRVGEEDR